MKVAHFLRRVRCLALLTLLPGFQSAWADSAKWNLNPINNDWNTAANWMPNTVPNGLSDVATFGVSQTTHLIVANAATGGTTAVGGIVFDPGASVYNITIAASSVEFPFILEIHGTGVSNNSGVTQQFYNAVDGGLPGRLLFFQRATAGDQMVYTNGGGIHPMINGGLIEFFDLSSAGSGTFINHGGTSSNAYGGTVTFGDCLHSR